MSISYEGKGHGSKKSLLLTALCGVGFLVVLVFFGLSTEVQTTKLTLIGEKEIEYTFSKAEFVMVSARKSTTNFTVFIYDGNFVKTG